MLNGDALSQLSQLKKDIQATKEYGVGTVVGSSGRFGFVKLEDGRDAFLSPEKMQRVIPGDQVRVCIESNDKGKLEASFEKLLKPAETRLIGVCRKKGAAYFIQPEGLQASRWIFLQPKMRGSAQEGDIIVAKLVNHPYKDGKASAKVVERVGKPEGKNFEHKYIRAKHDLGRPANPKTKDEIKTIETTFAEENFGERTDLSNIPFVTIDGEHTKDMDDAVACETLENGNTRLYVGVADPSNFIEQNSFLAKHAYFRTQSVYLLGGTVHMLPESLSFHCFSLEENKKRPALVCKMEISNDGEITDFQFEFATIKSQAKLSYTKVSTLLAEEENDIAPDLKPMLKTLYQLALTRRSYREKHGLLSIDQADFEYTLDEAGHISEAKTRSRTVAHTLVEEAMLACNTSAAKFFKKLNIGLFNIHPGFRADRMGEVLALLKEESVEHGDLTQLEDHIQLFKNLHASEDKSALAWPLRRMMDSVALSHEAKPHLGMGFEAYATVSSPIRRYADLYNHWAMRKALLDSKFKKDSADYIERLKESLQRGRQADRELTQWLLCLFAKTHIGNNAKGTIKIITQQGFGAKLKDTGIEGFVLFPKGTSKKYDAKRMTLEVDGMCYHLGDTVEISVKSVDEEKRRVAFELANSNSLKPASS